MKISSDEITSVIKKQIENYKVDLNVDEVGTVLEVGDGIAHVYGLQNCMAGELLELPNGVYGMAQPGRKQRRCRSSGSLRNH